MPETAWAVADEEAARTVIIVSTVGVAFLVGLILFHFSQRTSKGRFKIGAAPASDKTQAHAPPEEASPLLPAVLQEISRLSGSLQKQQQVARAVSDLISRSAEQRVQQVRQESTQRTNQLIQEHRKAESAIERKYQQTLTEKKQTTAVLESIAEGLVVVNPKGDVVMMNPAAERLLGVTQQKRVGKPLLEDLKDEQLVSMVHSSAQGEREIIVSAKQDSTKKVLRASNAVVTDEHGNTVGMVAVLSDVTKQRELDEMKSEFLSKVSHELRTPLVAMRHALSILIDQVAGPMSEEQQKFLDISQRNLDRLSQLINDLLDLSKLEAQKMELRAAPMAIGGIIGSVCESMSAWAASKRITLSAQAAADLPEISADAARITQVLTNLIGNAIKFTPDNGRVTVDAKLAAEGRQVEVSVSDTGVGVAQEDLSKLFNKFQQVGARSASDISGTGLGLAISKEIVELHRGRIWAESDAQQGARFIFTLPLAPPS
ncbi:MAG: PAS domain-containing protein [Candidatus Omnitrophica bacterium]|nr:PAS domain-containing protein [Candidatus Omnitrophota bacterium]